jgi:3-dehydroquinate synthetase
MSRSTRSTDADPTGRSAISRALRIRFGNDEFPYLVRHGTDALGELGGLVAGLQPCRWILVTDTGVPSLTVELVRTELEKQAPVILLRADAEETAKTWQAVGRLGSEAIRRGATRRTIVVAVGGGIVGNMAGLLACALFRGVPLAHIPTTLLAASDSVLSRKQAVNTPYGKNHLGGFHPATLVWTPLDFLESLHPGEFRAAWCEAIKNCVGICPAAYPEFSRRLKPDAAYDPGDLAWLIGFCAEAKQAVMRHDLTETRSALVLELGHTLAHALETAAGGMVSHGIAVGLGLLCSATTARLMGVAGSMPEDMFRDLLTRNAAPVTFAQLKDHVPASAHAALDKVDAETLIGIARRDNKAGYAVLKPGELGEVLLEAPGAVHRIEAQPLPGDTASTLPRPGRASATWITPVPEEVYGTLSPATCTEGSREQ